MRVTRNDISKQFDALIDGTRTREDVEKWAEACMHSADLGELAYEPVSAEEQLWHATTYLLGAGLKTSASDYLHDLQDVEHSGARWTADAASSESFTAP